MIIDVADVKVKMGDSSFVDLDTDFPGRYDLIQLTAGADTLIGTSPLSVGELTEIRLILGDDNEVKCDGQFFPLNTPSAQQSGLKIKFDEPVTLEEGREYTLTLDFDAGRSVVRAGNSGRFNLRPVIWVSIEATIGAPVLGSVRGTLAPALPLYVQAISTADTLGTRADSTGLFVFTSMPTGSYDITVVAPDSADFDDKVIEDVIVSAGLTTRLGTIELD